MSTVITDNRVTDRDAYLPLAKAFAKDGVKDKGCYGMQVFANLEQADRVVFISEWDSKEYFLAYV